MSRRIVFVTQELESLHGGGAGPVVGGLARRLDGDDVVVLVAAPHAAGAAGSGYAVSAVDVPEPDGSTSWFLERSRLVARRLAALMSEARIDLIEFTDFEATALWTLAHRHELGLEQTRIAVRLHGPVEAVSAAMGAAPPPLDDLAVLERLVFGMADAVIVPSVAIGGWAVDRYGIEPDRVVVGPPPVPPVEPVGWRPAESPVFAAFGSLGEHKGTHDLARAMVPVLERHPGARLVFVGPDGWSASEERPMSEVVLDIVPESLHDRVEFTGSLPREDALRALSSAWAVVIASRFESFCLAAHEARRASLPVVAARLPAFEDFETGFGIRLYDGSVEDLTATLGDIATDRTIVERLVREPVPPVGDPVTAYRSPLPAPRHPRSQAGLATEALQRVEELLVSPPRRLSGAARAVLRLVPGPVARLAVRMLPQGLKDRFRGIASWPAEEARRHAVRRRALVEAAIEAGGFPETAEPDATVVVPCFDQGRWVIDAVLSVFEQTHRSWEIVVVDDGSTDPDTIRVLDEIAVWPRVRLLRQENRGLAAARNAGMALARGRYLVPLDADDEIMPGFLGTLIDRLEEEPEAAFAHCWAELFGDVEGIWATRPVNAYWDLLSNSVVGCVLLRRSAWEAIGGYDESMRDGNEDWELWVRLRGAGWGQVRVAEPLFRYRKHGVSMSVITEGAFERGRRQLAERNPQLYAVDALRAMKRRLYPLLTVLGDGSEPDVDDVQVVVAPDPATAMRQATGKYVVDRQNASWPVEDAVALGDRLEEAPDRAWAHDPESGAVVWRRWALLDPGCGLDGGLGPTPPSSGFRVGAFPDAEWMVDHEVAAPGVRIIRQRPEEPGRIPEWVGR
jgi:glycosyltransferase involved in cell wall biosynthesis/GT2 family glycosyltransferase